MTTNAFQVADQAQPPPILSFEAVLNALDSAVILLDPNDNIIFANSGAENLFGASLAQLTTLRLGEFVPADSPLFALINHVRQHEDSIVEYGLTLDSPRLARADVNVHVAFVAEMPGQIVVTFSERSMADKIDRQLTHRNALRSVTAMAAMLAHEVKNPLSGIRGAAQLLEQDSNPDDAKLTRLICDETDRIRDLVDRMEVFSDNRPIELAPVNIHEVLGYVRQIADAGIARGVKIVERYDPSLPPVHGHRDQLVQIFLNLVKNAAEAITDHGGEITLTTAYQHGVRFAVPGTDSRTHLPLAITVEDNGPGIPPDLQDHLFEPFVTSKSHGTGLGLSLVAKMIGDHGGVIEFDSRPGRTIFRVMMAVAPANYGPG